MIIIQQQGNNQLLGSLYVSSPFTLNISNPTPVTITGGDLFVNGTHITAFPYTVNPLDSITVQILNSSNIATTSYAILTVDTDQYSISSTTITDPIHYHRTDSIGIDPFDYLTYPNGYKVYPYAANNKISVVNSLGNITSINTSSYAQSTDSYPLDSSIPLVFVANYSNDSIYVIDSTHTIVGRISLGVGAEPTYLFDYPTAGLVVVSQTGLNSVAIIDRVYGTVIVVVPVGNRPMGITIDYNNNIWVANFTDNTITVISSTDYSILSIISVGQGPIDITTDSAGNIWVANSINNTVSVINPITFAVITSVSVGTNPWGLCSVGGYIYVSNSYSDNISKIDIGTNSVVSTIPTNTIPYSITSNSSTSFYVACMDSSTIQHFVNDVLQQTIDVPKYPFGITIDSANNLWIPDFYENLPPRTYVKSQTPNKFSFLSIRNAHKSTVYTSNTVTINGLDEASNASIPPIAGSYIIKNAINVGFSTTVVNGDVLSIVVTTSSAYGDVLSTELTIGNWSALYKVETELYSATVYNYHFNTINNANTNTNYNSNVVTIHGLSSDISSPVSITNGTLFKNNISVGTSTTIVNGDTLQIQLTSSSNANTPASSYVVIGDIVDMFTVITAGSNVFKVIPIYDLGTLSNQPVNILEYSNVLTITQVLDNGALPPDPLIIYPVTISIDSYVGTQIIKNGIGVGQTTTVTENDTIQLTGYSPLYSGYTRIINLYMGSWVFPWTIHTTPDLIPYPFLWQDVFNQIPGTTITSNAALVDGMTPGYPLTVNVPYGTLLVNNIPSNTIQYGDLVALQLIEKPPFSATRQYKISAGGVVSSNILVPSTGIISTWNVTAMSLTYPVHWENTNLSAVPLKFAFHNGIEKRTNPVSRNFVLSHGEYTHASTTVLLPVHLNGTVKQYPIPTTFAAPTVPTVRQFTSPPQLGIIAATKPVSVSFSHGIEHVSSSFKVANFQLTPLAPHLNSVNPQFVKSFVTSSVVVRSFTKSTSINTNIVNPQFVKSFVTSSAVVPGFTKLTSINTNTVNPQFIKSSVVSRTVLTQFNKSFVVGNTIPTQFIKSSVVSRTIPTQFNKSFVVGNTIPTQLIKSFVVGNTIPTQLIKSFVVGNTIPTQLIKSTTTSYVIFNSGPEYYDYEVYQNPTEPHIGTFGSSNAAIAAGLAAGYTNVNYMRLPGGGYIWVVSANDCLLAPPTTPGNQVLLYGYKQGG
jgi:YVTN family beta-propeller protein